MESFIATYLPLSFGSFVISFVFSVFIGIVYSIFHSLTIWDMRKEVLRNAKDNEVLTEDRVSAKILKKNPSAFDYERKSIILTTIIFIICIVISIVTQVFFGKDIASKLYLNSSKVQTCPVSFDCKTYEDKSGKFKITYDSKYVLEKNDFGGVIYNPDHRRLFRENASFGEIAPLQISFELIQNLPKSGGGAPQIKFDKKEIGKYTVLRAEVIPAAMPNIHYFVMLPEGYLDLSIDPVFNNPTDNQILFKISLELEQQIDFIIRNLETK